MKRYLFKLQALCIALVLLSGCSDFLDKEPLGNSTAENYYDTQYKLQTALNAAYDILQSDDFTSSEWRFGEAIADDVIGIDEGLSSQMGQLANFRFTTSNTYIKQRWEINYQGIHRVNQVIANADKVKISTTDYNAYRAVREILGQAKFLRAIYYFNLVKTFGGVPIRPEVEDVNNLVIPRSSKEEVYAYIEKDLREAACMLVGRYTSDEAGKASAGAAVGMLMKVLMYQAVPGTQSDKWKEMVTLGRYFIEGETMTMGKILRYDERYDEDWESLRQRLWFKPKALCTASDPYEGPDYEIAKLSNAFSLKYADAWGNAISYLDQFYSAGEFCKGSVFEIVFKESGDGSTGDTNEGTSVWATLFVKGGPMYDDDALLENIFGSDYRRRFVIGHQETTPDGQQATVGSSRAISLKWYTPVKDQPIYSSDNAKNRRYLRFVDVVLMYAEALNECGNGAEALTQLNKCKSVVNEINGSSTLYVGGGYGFMRDQIWKERRVELVHEWDRFFDIVRQGRAATLMRTYSNLRSNRRGAYFREGINEIFPIPQTEIDVSNGVVTQNPGY